MSALLLILLVVVLTPIVVFFSVEFGTFAFYRGRQLHKEFLERENK